MFVPIQAQAASPQAKELVGYLQQVVDLYRESHPDLTSLDVSTALRLARVHYAPGVTQRARVAAIVLVLLAAVLGFFRWLQP